MLMTPESRRWRSSDTSNATDLIDAGGGDDSDCVLPATKSVFDSRSIPPEVAAIVPQIGPCYR